MHGRTQRGERELDRLFQAKQASSRRAVTAALGPAMLGFFRSAVQKRQSKLARLAECWGALVPEPLSDRCALESYSRGTLTVLVDSSSHLYDLKQLMLAGLEQQLLLAGRSAGLRKINLKYGRWYRSGDDGQNAAPRFE